MRRCVRRPATTIVLAILSLTLARSANAQCGSAGGAFVNFESGHVRPLALMNGVLLAVNTPDNRLAIYTVSAGAVSQATPRLTLAAEVSVGLEPVAVAVRAISPAPRLEAWVVNHLSDSVSIVEVDPTSALTLSQAHVKRTLLVGDEPRDVLFAGSGGNRAFITCARRGQSRFPQTTL